MRIIVCIRDLYNKKFDLILIYINNIINYYINNIKNVNNIKINYKIS
jgi:hypothetical protein